MHAYLFTGNNSQIIYTKIQELAKKLKVKLIENEIKKVEDVRALNNFVSLSITQPTAIYISSIENCTPEGLNAFLKNLEEPQENLYFLLSAKSIHKVLPTIVSRCQIIRVNGEAEEQDFTTVEKFILGKSNQQLALIDKIKCKEDATDFLSTLLAYLHQLLVNENSTSKETLTKLLFEIENTIQSIRANGNVSLQLTNLVVNMGDIDTSNLKTVGI
jgi:DNA polymerase-3 subunit delta'